MALLLLPASAAGQACNANSFVDKTGIQKMTDHPLYNAAFGHVSGEFGNANLDQAGYNGCGGQCLAGGACANHNPDIAEGTAIRFCINDDDGNALEFPRCAVECTAERLDDACTGLCAQGTFCCPAANGACIPNGDTCPCPECATPFKINGVEQCAATDPLYFVVQHAAGTTACCAPPYEAWALPLDVCGFVPTGSNDDKYIYDTRFGARQACLDAGCTGLADATMVTTPQFDWVTRTVDSEFAQADGGGGRCTASWWDANIPEIIANRPGYYMEPSLPLGPGCGQHGWNTWLATNTPSGGAAACIGCPAIHTCPSPPPAPPPSPPPSPPPPSAPPSTPPSGPPRAPPSTPPSTPPGTPPSAPPSAPPSPPPSAPPSTPPSWPPRAPPSAPPGTPPSAPPGTPPSAPPSPPPSVPPPSPPPPGVPPSAPPAGPPSTPPSTPPTPPPPSPPPSPSPPPAPPFRTDCSKDDANDFGAVLSSDCAAWRDRDAPGAPFNDNLGSGALGLCFRGLMADGNPVFSHVILGMVTVCDSAGIQCLCHYAPPPSPLPTPPPSASPSPPPSPLPTPPPSASPSPPPPPPSPGPAPPPPPPALNGAPGPMPSPVLVLGAMGILALCCCCSCWIFGGRLPGDDGILARDRDREREKEDKEPLTVVSGVPVKTSASWLPLMSLGRDNTQL